MHSPGRGGWGAETSQGVVAGWAALGTIPPGPQVRSSVRGVSPGHPSAPAPFLREASFLQGPASVWPEAASLLSGWGPTWGQEACSACGLVSPVTKRLCASFPA